MPTVAELQRLRALLERLAPLAALQRGTLIRADDWNTIVGAVIELAQVVLERDAGETVAPHGHPDQVQLSWLDQRLRSLLEQGPLVDPAAAARIAELERRLGRQAEDATRVRGRLDEVRDRVTEVSGRDLIRAADVTKVRRAVESAGDARQDVLTLRQSLEAIRGDVRRAVEVGEQLEVDGQPLDVPALVARVVELEQLRERLRLPSGALLDAAALELRLTELTTTLVTEEELDEAIRNAQQEELPEDQRQALLEQSRALAAADLTAALDGFRAEVDTMRKDLEQKITVFAKRIGPTVKAELEEQLPARLAPLEELQVQVKELQVEVKELTVRVRRLEERVGPGLGDAEPATPAPELERLVAEQVDRAAKRLRANLRDQVRRDLDRRESQLRELIAEVVEERLAR